MRPFDEPGSSPVHENNHLGAKPLCEVGISFAVSTLIFHILDAVLKHNQGSRFYSIQRGHVGIK